MSIVNSYRESGLIYRLGERIIAIDPSSSSDSWL